MGSTFVYPGDLRNGDVLVGKGHLGHRTVGEVRTTINFQTAHRHFIVYPITDPDTTFQVFAADVMVEIEIREENI